MLSNEIRKVADRLVSDEIKSSFSYSIVDTVYELIEEYFPNSCFRGDKRGLPGLLQKEIGNILTKVVEKIKEKDNKHYGPRESWLGPRV